MKNKVEGKREKSRNLIMMFQRSNCLNLFLKYPKIYMGVQRLRKNKRKSQKNKLIKMFHKKNRIRRKIKKLNLYKIPQKFKKKTKNKMNKLQTR